jgi:hypothetical protein
MKYILLLTISLIASGCYTGIGQHSSKFNKVSLGMSKGEVIDAIGKPQSTRAANGVEYMTYNVYEVVFGQYVPYFVRIKNGKVDLKTVFTHSEDAFVFEVTIPFNDQKPTIVKALACKDLTEDQLPETNQFIQNKILI